MHIQCDVSLMVKRQILNPLIGVRSSDIAPIFMYYTLTPQLIDKESPTYTSDYIEYVESLRQEFSIRIEVRSNNSEYHACTKLENDLKNYLDNILSKDKWSMQQPTGFVGLYYFWFMDKQDALAFALKFGGRVV
jgi:hypothetical protein